MSKRIQAWIESSICLNLSLSESDDEDSTIILLTIQIHLGGCSGFLKHCSLNKMLLLCTVGSKCKKKDCVNSSKFILNMGSWHVYWKFDRNKEFAANVCFLKVILFSSPEKITQSNLPKFAPFLKLWVHCVLASTAYNKKRNWLQLQNRIKVE